MNIFVVDERFERPLDVTVPDGLSSLSAEACGLCHAAIYREWSGSMHAKAWIDPYFRVDFIFDGSQQICLNCQAFQHHAPCHMPCCISSGVSNRRSRGV